MVIGKTKCRGDGSQVIYDEILVRNKECEILDTLPTGFAMALAQDAEKINIVDYIQSAITGDDAKQRIKTTVQNMHNYVKMFLK